MYQISAGKVKTSSFLKSRVWKGKFIDRESQGTDSLSELSGGTVILDFQPERQFPIDFSCLSHQFLYIVAAALGN